MTTSLARTSTVADIITEYEAKSEAAESTIKTAEQALTALNMSATVQGVYIEPIAPPIRVNASMVRKNLLKSGWKAIYNRLQIDRVATAKDKNLFDRTLTDPPELTLENAKATFGDYLMRHRHHVLRGLAEVFCDLDPAYKSHSKVKIGVSGLPKRVIITNVSGWGSYGRDKLWDVMQALAAVRGAPVMENDEFNALDALRNWQGHIAGEVEFNGCHAGVDENEMPRYPNRSVKVRKFQNGNAHLIFGPDALLEINLALAEFYGDVLPDVEPENVKPSASTAVSKDLQFYGTPKAVAEMVCKEAGIYADDHRASRPVLRVLEPSCGDGRIMDEVKRRGQAAFGVEYHPRRADEARAKGHNVLTANFLDQPPFADFDVVVMNPPFYGRHYVKHVRHALKFLKPGGVLVSVLPATAHYDHKELEGKWRDLPVASFACSGTNVPTGLLTIVKEKP